MARFTYVGSMTDFGRTAFPSAEPRLFVRPVQPGYGGLGLMSDRDIPVTIESDGSFSVLLESSQSVRPEAQYELICEWLDTSGVSRGFSRWAIFNAAPGGGNIADMIDLPAPSIGGIMYGFGPPPAGLSQNVIYLDIAGDRPVVYGPKGVN